MITELWCENNINQAKLMSFPKNKAESEKSDYEDKLLGFFIVRANIHLIHGGKFLHPLVDCVWKKVVNNV